MSVADYDKKFLVIPEGLTTDEYRKQRKNNPNVIYGKM